MQLVLMLSLHKLALCVARVLGCSFADTSPPRRAAPPVYNKAAKTLHIPLKRRTANIIQFVMHDLICGIILKLNRA